MRLRRAISWLMVVSPVVYLLYIAGAARLASFGGRSPAPDPPGFEARLRAYVPFVQAVRGAKAESIRPGTPECAALLDSIVAKVTGPLPTVESTKPGACWSDDLRYPIYEAKQACLALAWRHYHAACKERDENEARRAAMRLLTLSNIQRYADCQAVVACTSVQTAALEAFRHHLRTADRAALRQAYEFLTSFESNRGTVAAPMRIDMHLLTSTLASNGQSSTALAVSELLSSALDAACRGESLLPFARAGSVPETGGLRDQVRTTILSWDLALRHEDASQRAVRSLIVEIYGRLATFPDERERLAELPPFIFAATARGQVPELRSGDHGYALVYANAPAASRPAAVVAAR